MNVNPEFSRPSIYQIVPIKYSYFHCIIMWMLPCIFLVWSFHLLSFVYVISVQEDFHELSADNHTRSPICWLIRTCAILLAQYIISLVMFICKVIFLHCWRRYLLKHLNFLAGNYFVSWVVGYPKTIFSHYFRCSFNSSVSIFMSYNYSDAFCPQGHHKTIQLIHIFFWKCRLRSY